MHMRQIIGCFNTDEQRIEVAVIFYLRIKDQHNSKLFRVRFKREQIVILEKRLGDLTFFPFLQPENEKFHLDLSFHDQRISASLFVSLSGREKVSNISEPEYIREDGTLDPLEIGVPRSWEHADKMPTSGVFKGTYICAPEY